MTCALLACGWKRLRPKRRFATTDARSSLYATPASRLERYRQALASVRQCNG
jgi:hypothetical protein